MTSGDHLKANQDLSHRSKSEEASTLKNLLASQTAGRVVALVAAVAAVIWAMIDATSYHRFQHIDLGPLTVEHWAADGGLAIFFFLAGLELKREFVTGSLRDRKAAAIPIAAACCGVAVPALIFIAVNAGGPHLAGWAIPAPTDIAFALAVLAVLGRSAPEAWRIFLLTLAVVDDLIVIAIIAIGYSSSLNLAWLAGAIGLIALYALCSVSKQVRHVLTWALVPLAIGAWWCTLHSGIHATVAGLILALLTPVNEPLERVLSPWSASVVVPVFALTSAGVSLGSNTIGDSRVFWGVFFGLVIGKPVGIMLGARIAGLLIRPRTTAKNDLATMDLVGLGFLGGIGFTVALLVTDLAYSAELNSQAKAAVLTASVTTAAIGTAILACSPRRRTGHPLPSNDPAG